MDWTQQFDGYCERTDFSFWAEPLNAWTNALYVIGGVYMLWRCRRNGLPITQVLGVTLVLIGIGSFLFHTFATAWASLADVAPIGAFILVYLFAVNRDVIGMKWWVAVLATSLFAPYAAAVVWGANQLPFFRISNFYWAVPLLLLAYAPVVTRRNPATARGMVFGAALLSVSIAVRSVDEAWCHHWPHGTHIGWHFLNSIMLPKMIEVYRRHMLEAGRGKG